MAYELCSLGDPGGVPSDGLQSVSIAFGLFPRGE